MSNIQVIRRLLGLTRPMAGWMVLAVVLGVAGFLAAILIPSGGMLALVHVLAGRSYGWIFWMMGFCALARGVLRYGEQACNHYIAFKLLARVRDIVFGKLRSLAPARLEGRDRGDLIALITSDVELLEVFYAHTISPVCIALLVSLLFVLVQWRMHWMLGLLALAGYVFVGAFLPWLLAKRSVRYGVSYRNKSGQLNALVLESVRGMDQVRQFGARKKIVEKIEKQTRDLGNDEEGLKSVQGQGSALTGAAVMVFSGAMLLLATLLAASGEISVMSAMMAFILEVSSFGPVIALSALGTGLMQTLGAARRVLEILDASPVVSEQTNGKDEKIESMKLENVTFAYENKEILKDFSLDIGKGKILGISGPSGCGKSTMLRLLMRFWDVNGGEVKASGTNIRQISTGCLRQNQSFVTQDSVLFHDSIRSNLLIAKANATSEELEAACRKAGIHDFILSLPDGYDSLVGELGSTLSGGERQRIGLARAFLHDGPVLLLDEPTSNLDSLNEGAILQAVDQERENRTVVLVSHRASTLGFADVKVRMEKNDG